MSNGPRLEAGAPRIAARGLVLDVPESTLADTLKSRALRWSDRRPRTRRILKGIDLDVFPGERVGVIGRNGAGKTTLLKCLAGIYPPTEGRVEKTGRVAPVIAQGVGFDGELDLLENLKVTFAYRGQLEAYDDALGRSILEFAELEERATAQFKHLSSGNQARLAFASTLYHQAEILLLDEVFATGDAAFVSKAKKRMLQLIERTPILILASHDATLIRDVCTRCVLVEDGAIVHDGSPNSALSAYRERLKVGVSFRAPAPAADAP